MTPYHSRRVKRAAFVAAVAAILIFPVAASAASLSTLHHRASRQDATLLRDRGTVRFFHRHPFLARTLVGRRALRFARAELAWTAREQRQLTAEVHAREMEAAKLADPIGYRERYACAVWGAPWGSGSCRFVLSVTHCEGGGYHWSRGDPEHALNGQYVGAWQMGTRERSIYGDSPTFEGQTRAAHDYYLDAGWRPWACA